MFLFSLRKSLHNAQSTLSAVGQFHAISLHLFHTAFISLCVDHFDLIIYSKLQELNESVGSPCVEGVKLKSLFF